MNKHIAAALLLSSITAAPAEIRAEQQKDFFNLSIEELSNIEVTSVSRKAERVSEAASAVYVITGEDIRRSGVTTIAEALRLAPGIQVSRIDSNRWAISSRGFNNAFALKLLVMIDGRTVYNPLFSGVFWDTQDVLLEDVDRIEIIRGPGASLWGANAVNGVINIITKSAKDTKGGYTEVGGGKEERGFAAARYGDNLGDNTHYRVYAKYFDRDHFERAAAGNESKDAWSAFRGGFRSDTTPNETDLVTFQGDAYHMNQDQAHDLNAVGELFTESLADEVNEGGANVLSRWTRSFSETSDAQFQFYYDYVSRDDAVLTHNINTLDFDFQHRFSPLERHDFLWGLTYRNYHDSTQGTFDLAFEPEDRAMDLYTGFIQDEIVLIENRLALILGTKVEKNVFTGVEYQPTARAVWTPDEQQTVWGALSRATRTPSRLEHDARVFYGGAAMAPQAGGNPVLVRGFGNPDAAAENLHAYELGYRNQITSGVSVDVAAFYNDYSDHLSIDPQQPSFQIAPFSYLLVPVLAGNDIDFRSHGAEVAVNWNPVERWRLVGTYSYINVDFGNSSTTTIPFLKIITQEAAEHLITLRSLLSVTETVEFDATVRHTAAIAVGAYGDPLEGRPGQIPDWTELDLRLGWRPKKNFDISLIGQNLLHPGHVEWIQPGFGQPTTNIERSIYARLTYRF